jgi:hypothetical protein
MSICLLFLRLATLWSLAIWLGGFTFYSGVVIPILHEQLGSPLETGLVTQRVTVVLNQVGMVVSTLGWMVFAVEWLGGVPARGSRKLAASMLLVMTASLLALLILHRMLDGRLADGEMKGFYPLHRVYVWVNTIEWAAGMLLLAVWGGSATMSGIRWRRENPQVLGS